MLLLDLSMTERNRQGVRREAVLYPIQADSDTLLRFTQWDDGTTHENSSVIKEIRSYIIECAS